MQLVVGVEGGRHVAGPQRGSEAAVGGTHQLEVLGGEARNGLAHRDLVHRGDDVTGLANRAHVEVGDDGRAAGAGGHEAGLAEPEQGLTHGRTAHAQPVGELEVAQLLTGRERALDDRVLQPSVHVVAQQRAVDRGCVLWDGHAIYCTSDRCRGQGCAPTKVASVLDLGSMCRELGAAYRRAMKRQVWELTDDGVHHRVEVTGDVNRTVRWYVDDELALEKKSMEDKLTVTRDGGQALTIRHSGLGSPRRASLYDDQATALVGIGGTDLVPEPGSRAAAWEQRIIDHPRRHTLIATLGGVAKVVVPIVAVAILIPLLGLIPRPDLPSIPFPDLPDIPWPNLPSAPWPDVSLPDWQLPGWVRWVLDHAKYVVPVIVAFAVARGEIRRRRQQLEQRRATAGSADPADER